MGCQGARIELRFTAPCDGKLLKVEAVGLALPLIVSRRFSRRHECVRIPSPAGGQCGGLSGQMQEALLQALGPRQARAVRVSEGALRF